MSLTQFIHMDNSFWLVIFLSFFCVFIGDIIAMLVYLTSRVYSPKKKLSPGWWWTTFFIHEVEVCVIGRPTKYKPDYDEQAYKLALLGHTDIEMANFWEVEEKTVNLWKKKFPSFLQALKKGKDVADANVVQSLYKRATGYDAKATKFATFEGKITDKEEYIEHYPPDPTAIIYWLKNRQPAKWRDKPMEENANTSGDLDKLVNAIDILTKNKKSQESHE